MNKETLNIDVPLKDGKIICLKLSSKSGGGLFRMVGDEVNQTEAPNQIVEGKIYDFIIDDKYFLKDLYGIVNSNRFNKSIGTISPNIYVGTLTLEIFHNDETEKCGDVKLEVQSIKTDYRKDYRQMLSDITEQCIELVFQHSSPVTQVVEVDDKKDFKTWHQRFAFIKSVIDTEEFRDAVNKVISSPVTRWAESEIDKDIRSVRRFNNKALRQIASATNRIELPAGHLLKSSTLDSIPTKIRSTYKTETVDTPENRFVKYALQTFLFFVSDFISKIKEENKIKLEATEIENYLEQILSHSFFKTISKPTSVLLNSPVLQRKEGYREILKVWFMFNLAAKLTWKGGDDVYDIGKRNVAVLYEYWLFFQLLKIVEKVFGITADKNLIIDKTNDQLGLQLKQGEHFPIKGICNKDNRSLEIQFSYNRTFSGSNKENNYPDAGSWTKSMRPDYTLSIWPAGISELDAERQELITHIHFDAKYKIEKVIESFGSDDENLDDEKTQQSKGTYKRADLLKMHAYKDAIRRTSGAYILYPGNEKTTYRRKGFRELIPGLGAFQIRPSVSTDNGSMEIEYFFEDVVDHLVNRTSQREKTAYRVYDIHKDELNKDNELREALPETYGVNRNLLPDETFVLVGFSTSSQRFKWYEENGKYVFRMDEDKGSLELNTEVVNAKYLLIRKSGEEKASALFKIKSKGPKVFSVSQLQKLNYPLSQNPKEYYLVIEIEKVSDKEFENVSWKFKELKKYKSIIEAGGNHRTIAGLPFTVSLTELMNSIDKK